METLMSKRTFLGTAAAALAGLHLPGCAKRTDDGPVETFEVTKSPDEWAQLLTPEQYVVLREESTERPRSSPLNDEKRDGTYACAACALPVYRAAAKFESGTGWPSFTSAIEGNIGTKEDDTFFTKRTEVHCRRCGSHLGHVFDDGPPPTGQRYCMNGVAMNFTAA